MPAKGLVDFESLYGSLAALVSRLTFLEEKTQLTETLDDRWQMDLQGLKVLGSIVVSQQVLDNYLCKLGQSISVHRRTESDCSIPRIFYSSLEDKTFLH